MFLNIFHYVQVSLSHTKLSYGISGIELKCGLHKCNRRCHNVTDHSQMSCTHLLEKTCARQHKRKTTCARKNEPCDICVKEDLETERRVKRDLDLERKRLAREADYKKELTEIQDELAHHRNVIKYAMEEEAQKSNIAQQRQDLQALQEASNRTQQMKQLQKERAEAAGKNTSQSAGAVAKDKGIDVLNESLSIAQEEWKYCKEVDGARSKPMDELMDMIGLEDVKIQFLEIKATVDTKLSPALCITYGRNPDMTTDPAECRILETEIRLLTPG